MGKRHKKLEARSFSSSPPLDNIAQTPVGPWNGMRSATNAEEQCLNQ